MLSFFGASIPRTICAPWRRPTPRGNVAVAERGVAYATAQARGLIDGGAPGVHLYTLNKAEACLKIVGGLGL